MNEDQGVSLCFHIALLSTWHINLNARLHQIYIHSEDWFIYSLQLYCMYLLVLHSEEDIVAFDCTSRPSIHPSMLGHMFPIHLWLIHPKRDSLNWLLFGGGGWFHCQIVWEVRSMWRIASWHFCWISGKICCNFFSSSFTRVSRDHWLLKLGWYYSNKFESKLVYVEVFFSTCISHPQRSPIGRK